MGGWVGGAGRGGFTRPAGSPACSPGPGQAAARPGLKARPGLWHHSTSRRKMIEAGVCVGGCEASSSTRLEDEVDAVGAEEHGGGRPRHLGRGEAAKLLPEVVPLQLAQLEASLLRWRGDEGTEDRAGVAGPGLPGGISRR